MREDTMNVADLMRTDLKRVRARAPYCILIAAPLAGAAS
jgi:hypothetical protein